MNNTNSSKSKTLKHTNNLVLTYHNLFNKLSAKDIAEAILKQSKNKKSIKGYTHGKIEIKPNPIQYIDVCIHNYEEERKNLVHAHVLIILTRDIQVKSINYWPEVLSIKVKYSPNINLYLDTNKDRDSYREYINDKAIDRHYIYQYGEKLSKEDTELLTTLNQELEELSAQLSTSDNIDLNQILEKYPLKIQQNKYISKDVKYLNSLLPKRKHGSIIIPSSLTEADLDFPPKHYENNPFFRFFVNLIIRKIINLENIDYIEFIKSKTSLWIEGESDTCKSSIIKAAAFKVAQLLTLKSIKCVVMPACRVEDLKGIHYISKDTVIIVVFDDMEFENLTYSDLLRLLQGNIDDYSLHARYDNIKIDTRTYKIFISNYTPDLVFKDVRQEHMNRVDIYEVRDVMKEHNNSIDRKIQLEDKRISKNKKNLKIKSNLLKVDLI